MVLRRLSTGLLLLFSLPVAADDRPLIVTAMRQTEAVGGTAVPSFGFEEADIRRLESLPAVGSVLPSRTLTLSVRCGAEEVDARVKGITAAHLRLADIQMAEGRCIDEGDVYRLYSVAVVSTSLARKLFHHAPAVGKLIRVHSNYFRIVGVADQTSVPNDVVLIPVSTLRARFGRLHVMRATGAFEVESCVYDQIVIVPADDTMGLSRRVENDLRSYQPGRQYRFLATDVVPIIRTE